MKTTIKTAKDYNLYQPNPSMRFRTDSGKDRETGYVVTWGTTSQWFPNRGQAKLAAKGDAPVSIPSAATGERYDHNS